jgi:hypothetical protein
VGLAVGASKQEIEARFVEERFRFSDEAMIASARLCSSSVEAAKAAGVVATTISIKGDAEVDELKPGLTYRFYGRWADYKNKRSGLTEKQFCFTSFVQALAHDEDGIVAYLEQVGEGHGMGRGTAKKAWEEWGSDAVRVIRENPRELLKVNRRITDDQLFLIGEKLVAMAKVEHATIELTNLLNGRGFSKKLPRKLIQEWGNKAADFVRKDPYRLMNFRGCGFKLCDQLYLELGHKPSRLRRQALCGWYAVASDTSGDVWFPRAKVVQAIRAAIGAKADPDRAIEFGQRLGRLSPEHYGALAVCKTDGTKGPLSESGDRQWLAEGKRAEQERRLARLIVRANEELKPMQMTQFEVVEEVELTASEHMRCARCSRLLSAPEVHVWNGRPFGPTCIGYISDGTDVSVVTREAWFAEHPQVQRILRERATQVIDLPGFSLWPEVSEIKMIDDHQRGELEKALMGRIGILGGSPGTGKTHTTAQLVRALLASGRLSPADIAIGCPTGKAAVRITEFLQAAGLPVRAKTWHSLLGIGKSEFGEGWSFKFNEKNPWPFRVIIGDEESMKDLSLMCAVMAARPRGAHMLLVGDINQLPPVGAGAPLRDMIAAGLPYGELTEIKRASGGIVEACRDIRLGKKWVAGDNLHIHPAGDAEDQLRFVERVLDRCRAEGLDPVWDCQIIVPLNGFQDLKKGQSPLSRHNVNARFQAYLNDEPKVVGCSFRNGDKIVCLKNDFISLLDPKNTYGIDESLLDNGRVYVANGQLAKVIEVEPKSIIAQLEKSDVEIRIPRGKQEESEDGDSDSSGCSFDLAYGLSCHKYQGSEQAVVIVLIDEYAGAKMVCDRSWLYTAISRAKRDCYLVGNRATMDSFCRKVTLPLRKTFLREQIGLVHAEKFLLEMV